MFKGNPYKIKNIPNLAMGLNDQLEPGEILDNEMADCENYSVDEASIRTAPGYVGYQSVVQTSKHWGIFHARFSNGTQRLIRQTGTKLQYDDGTGTWTDCTLPTAGSPSEAISLPENQPTFVMLNDKILYSDGATYTLSSTDGITWTIPTTGSPAEELPKGILVNSGKNRIYFIELSSSKIWFSEINDPLTVLADSWEYIDPNNGQNNRGAIVAPSGALLLFKEKSFYELDDVSTGMVGVNPLGQVKLASHHTLAATENSVMLMAVDGIYEYAGTMQKISGRIKSTGRNNVQNWNLATAAYANGEYRVSIPDADVSQNYNAQEYVVHKHIYRTDPEQPYVITRNRRYFGCYGVEYKTTSSLRRVRLYAGFSTTFSEGSPAETNCNFVYINIYKDSTITQGLNGAAQSGYFTTKYFTENIPYFVKKFKKFFYELSITQDTTITLSCRFSPNAQWTDISVDAETGDIEWTFSDGTTGGFDEEYGWASESIGRDFVDIENAEKPRGIQFKITTSSINDIIFYGFAFSFRSKLKFK